MKPLFRLWCLILTTLLYLAGLSSADQVAGNLVYDWNDTLIDIIGDLVDAHGGARAGRDDVHGYYIVSVALARSRPEIEQAYEEARLEALKQLNQFINGVLVSGASNMESSKYQREQDGQSHLASYKKFRSVVSERFKGHVSGAQVWRQGAVGKEIFVVLLIEETGLKVIDKLRKDKPTVSVHRPLPDQRQQDSRGGSGQETSLLGPSKLREQVVEVNGLAPLKGESKAIARRKAIQHALRNAVEQVNGVIIKGRTGRLGKHIASVIATRAEGYISSYKVLSEEQRGADYHVRVRAVVSAASLLKDVDFYLEVLGSPRFRIQASKTYERWLAKTLRDLGFNIVRGHAPATHEFRETLYQEEIPNPIVGGPSGYATELAVTLIDLTTSEELLTIRNEPDNTPIFVSPPKLAKVASEKLAQKQIKKVLAVELTDALAKRTQTGQTYKIVIQKADQRDRELFRHNLEGGGEGRIVSWELKDQNLVLNYQYPGSLSQLMDTILEELYASYSVEGKGRMPRALYIGSRKAIFEILKQ
ncbi:MAG: hypothetical protein LWX01_07540 [Deltaproteobacteria bacterium]|nr:hypothetical protein [Deltaproteobacteria bacterium]MDL1961537.1 hypothetical protein [Deltaproteobacteria bacterium]